MRAVFHLFTILVKVVEPDAMRICLILLWNLVMCSISTLRKHCAVLSLVTSFCKFHTPSLLVMSSCVTRHLGRILHSNPDMLNSKLGLSLLYTLTKELLQRTVVTDRGSRFFISQNTARPRLTSCFMSLIRASRGQHFLLLYPTMFSLFGSGCSVRNRWIRSLVSSAVNLNNEEGFIGVISRRICKGHLSKSF